MTDPPLSIIEVGIGIVFDRDPDRPLSNADCLQILVTRRAAGSVYAGYWEFPGGKCHDREDPHDCVCRELAEEVGIRVRVFGSFAGVVHRYPHGTVRLHPRLCRIESGSPPPRNIQVAEHRWTPISGLASFRFPEANEFIVRELADWARGRSRA